MLHGDFGTTVTGRADQRGDVAPGRDRLRLFLIGTVVGVIAGVLLGVARRGPQVPAVDYLTTAFSFVVLSTPVFVIGTLLKVAVAAGQPGGGHPDCCTSPERRPPASPAPPGPNCWTGCSTWCCRRSRSRCALVAVYSRYQRSAMLDVLGSDFLRTARAKGLTGAARCSPTGCAPR